LENTLAKNTLKGGRVSRNRTTPIRVICIEDFQELENHQVEWNNLLVYSTQVSPTQTYSWVKASLTYDLPAQTQWVCMLAYEDSLLIGICVLVYESERNFGFLRFKRYRNLYSPFHTTHADVLIRKGYEYALLDMYRKLESYSNAIPIISYRAILEEGSLNQAISQKKLLMLSFNIEKTNKEDYLILCDSFQVYSDSLKSKFKREIFRQERKMAMVGKVSYYFGDEDFPEDPFRLFLALEHSGWKGESRTSIASHNRDAKLFENAIAGFSTPTSLYWSFLYIDDVPVAGQLAVGINETLYIWKVGYKEDYSSMGPGNVLLFRVIERMHLLRQFRYISFMNERSWLSPFQPSKRILYDGILIKRIPGFYLLRKLVQIAKKRN
jgi:hypothetical protein